MVKPTWRILAFSALLGAVALPASAQMVIGGAGQPSVEVNWAVLDSLGRQPTLADMLKDDMQVTSNAVAAKLPGQQPGVTYRPYKAASAKAAPEPRKKAKVIPVAAKAEPAAALSEQVRAAQEPRRAAPAKVEAVKAEPVPAKPQTAEAPAKAQAVEASAKPQVVEAPAKPQVVEAPAKPVGPQVALPEVASAKPVQAAKVEPPPSPAEPVKTAATPAVTAVEPPPASAPAAAPASAAPAMVAAVPTPAPAPAAKPEPAPAPQVTALPSNVAVSAKGDTLSLMFAGDQAKLPAGAQAELQALARRMEKDESLGLQLLAFASGDEAGASKARRLSLSRALEVRKFLMEQGVRSTRIEVRALGNKLEGNGPADRVDAVVVNR